MIERIVAIKVSKRRGKKYTATVKDENGNQRPIHFGARDYQQYKDSTKIGRFSRLNHGDPSRRKRYFLRHSGIPNKKLALDREKQRSGGRYNAKILSHIYLW